MAGEQPRRDPYIDLAEEMERAAAPSAAPTHRRLKDFIIKPATPTTPAPTPDIRSGIAEYKPTEPTRPNPVTPGPTTPRSPEPTATPPSPEPTPVEKKGLLSPEWQSIVERYNKMREKVRSGRLRLDPNDDRIFRNMAGKILRRQIFSADELQLLDRHGR